MFACSDHLKTLIAIFLPFWIALRAIIHHTRHCCSGTMGSAMGAKQLVQILAAMDGGRMEEHLCI